MDRKQSDLQGQRQARLVRNKQDPPQERSNNLAESGRKLHERGQQGIVVFPEKTTANIG